LIPDRLVACGLRNGVTLSVGLRIVRPVVQLDHDLAVELGADGPLRVPGELAVVGQERGERYLREYMKAGEGTL